MFQDAVLTVLLVTGKNCVYLFSLSSSVCYLKFVCEYVPYIYAILCCVPLALLLITDDLSGGVFLPCIDVCTVSGVWLMAM